MIKKGITQAITIVISIVVLIVLALIIITVTTGNISQAGENAASQEKKSACNLWSATACSGKDAGVVTAASIGCACNCDGKSIGCVEASVSQTLSIEEASIESIEPLFS